MDLSLIKRLKNMLKLLMLASPATDPEEKSEDKESVTDATLNNVSATTEEPAEITNDYMMELLQNEEVEKFNALRKANPDYTPFLKKGTDLSGKKLSKVNLSGANMKGVIMVEAQLAGANLTDANMQGSDLRKANMLRANLTGADVRRANLEGTNLAQAELGGANINPSTKIKGTKFSGVRNAPAKLSKMIKKRDERAKKKVVLEDFDPGATKVEVKAEAEITNIKDVKKWVEQVKSQRINGVVVVDANVLLNLSVDVDPSFWHRQSTTFKAKNPETENVTYLAMLEQLGRKGVRVLIPEAVMFEVVGQTLTKIPGGYREDQYQIDPRNSNSRRNFEVLNAFFERAVAGDLKGVEVVAATAEAEVDVKWIEWAKEHYSTDYADKQVDVDAVENTHTFLEEIRRLEAKCRETRALSDTKARTHYRKDNGDLGERAMIEVIRASEYGRPIIFISDDGAAADVAVQAETKDGHSVVAINTKKLMASLGIRGMIQMGLDPEKIGFRDKDALAAIAVDIDTKNTGSLADKLVFSKASEAGTEVNKTIDDLGLLSSTKTRSG